MIIFQNDWPRITRDDISKFETKWNIKLPSDYREFLLNHNGGFPKPADIVGWDGESVFRFFPLTPVLSDHPDVEMVYQNVIQITGIEYLLPLGDTNTYAVFLMDLSSPSSQPIYRWNQEAPPPLEDFETASEREKWIIEEFRANKYRFQSFSDLLANIWHDPAGGL